MIKPLIGALLLGFAAVAGAQTPAQPPVNVHYGWAEVLNVDPVFAPVAQTGQRCPPPSSATQDHGAAGDGAAAETGHRAAASQAPAGTDTQAVCGADGDQDSPRQIVAYDVEYRYRGEVYLSRLPYDPGERLRVKVTVAPAD